MTIKKFDDATGAEIPLDIGLEVVVSFVGQRPKVSHFSSWDEIPRRVLDGTLGGDTISAVMIRDIALIPVPQTGGPRRGVPEVPGQNPGTP